MTEARRFGSGCVASPHYLASAAGLAVLAEGGNALDAAVAVNLTLAVAAPYTCGFGGDLFAIVSRDGELHGYNGSGRAPAAASVDAVRARLGGDEIPAFGPHSVSVPGAVEAWFALLSRFGSRSFSELARVPLRYAEEGVRLTERGAATMRAAPMPGPEFAERRRVYSRARPGELFRQPDMARTIRALSGDGAAAYYQGEIGEAIAGHLQSFGGLMAAEDLAGHRGEWVHPMSTTFHGVEVHELPPNSQGVGALEALNIAEGLDLGETESLDRHHLLVEACRLAVADVHEHVTDPGFMRVDAATLASKPWADERRRLIDPERAGYREAIRAPRGGTAYMCATDESGMCVSLIQSNFRGFGSGVTVPGWGINLQNRGSSFSLDPSHVNAIAPGKRPFHTIIPGFATRDGRPWLVFGSMGGEAQPQIHLQLLTRIVLDGLDVQDAIDRPRWMVSPSDWSLRAESRFPDTLLDGLASRGHRVNRLGPFSAVVGHAHAILVEDSGYAGATDPRAEGAVTGL